MSTRKSEQKEWQDLRLQVAQDKKANDWTSMHDAWLTVAKEIGTAEACHVDENYLKFQASLKQFEEKQIDSMHARMSQENFHYANKCSDLNFLTNRAHFKFIPASMIGKYPIGIATFQTPDNSITLQRGAIFVLEKETVFLEGYNRDINSHAHVHRVDKGKDSEWFKNNCADSLPPVGRAIYETDLQAVKARGKDAFTPWLPHWPLSPSGFTVPTPENLKGKCLLGFYKKENGQEYISCTFYDHHGKLLHNVKTDVLAPPENLRKDIGAFGPIKEDIFKDLVNKGHLVWGQDNRAKPRKTAEELNESNIRRAQRVLEARRLGHPVFYYTKGGKLRNNARDYLFDQYLHDHNGLRRLSLKYTEVLLETPSLSRIRGLMFTEGVVGKASLGCALWNISMQYHLFKNHNHYLPLYVLDHQKGLPLVAVPPEIVEFLRMLWSIQPLLTEAQCNKNFCNLLKQRAGMNQYSSLTDVNDLEKTFNALFTREDLLRVIGKIKNFTHLANFLKYVSKDQILAVIEQLPPELFAQMSEKDTEQFRAILEDQYKDLKVLAVFGLKLSERRKTTALQTQLAKLDTSSVSELEKLLESLPDQALVLYRNLNALLSKVYAARQFHLISLIDKLMDRLDHNQCTKFTNKTPAQLAAQAGQWDQLIKIASYRMSLVNSNPGKRVDYLGLGDALLHVAQAKQWSVFKRLISEFQVHDFTWHFENGYYPLNFIIKDKSMTPALKLELVQLMINAKAPDKRKDFIDSHYQDEANALYHALQEGNEAIIQCLLDAGAGAAKTMFDAAKDGRWNLVKILLEHQRNNFSWHFNASANDKKGFCALHFAIAEERLDMVQLMVQSKSSAAERDALINGKLVDGLSPLQLARNKGFKEIVSYLETQCNRPGFWSTTTTTTQHNGQNLSYR